MPRKVEVHRHLGGCIKPETVYDIMRFMGTVNGYSLLDVEGMMTCKATEGRSFQTFLDKFKILDNIIWNDWSIDIAISQVCRDIAAEGIEHCSISFSIDKYLRGGLWTAEGVLNHIYRCFRRNARDNLISVDLLLSLAYHSPRERQIEIASLISDEGMVDGIAGLDLVGDEHYFDSEFYQPIIAKWKEAGKITRAHVGELTGTQQNVSDAINIGVDRIAHGIHASDDDVKKATDLGIVFDMALHSNIYTGVIDNIINHPIKRMANLGAIITLSTDDPVQFNCTLEDEFKLALGNNLITPKQAMIIRNNADLAVPLPANLQ